MSFFHFLFFFLLVVYRSHVENLVCLLMMLLYDGPLMGGKKRNPKSLSPKVLIACMLKTTRCFRLNQVWVVLQTCKAVMAVIVLLNYVMDGVPKRVMS